VFIGPLDDVAPGEDTYSPHQSQSEFCAACHYEVFWDTVIYNSYGEWLESEYADPQSTHYQTCQGCHMPSSGTDLFARIQAGGLFRDPETIASYKFLRIGDADFMRLSADLSVTALRSSDSLDVIATIENNQTGHHLPTDSPMRQLILVVSATDKDSLPLAQVEGPSLPNWTDVGAPAKGYYGGLPGTTYAKILEEVWNQHSPSAAYWNQTRIISDNRIPALTSAVSSYSFRTNGSSQIYIDVKLIYRRAFIELRDLKNWDIEDLIISEAHLVVQ